MARPIASLKPEGIPLALLYLKRALERPNHSFLHKPAVTRQSLLQLETRLSTCAPEIRTLIFKDWITANLTDDGRVRMLNAVRQKRVTAKRRVSTHRSLRLPIETVKELESLAKRAGGMPLAKLLAALASVANVDAALREKLLMVGVAISLK